ncbi:histone-lysine N-methyltransferase SMYD3-like isoform X2 [Stegodyphus dumicola]|uniref:histone-lysine N-methyltransferase SMYD3-like isoform X2 n=1 Tax=Stegodyphus dumicola TaxID=202533 RepID=UPI0015B17263|nr:histone-lysine N-methyltransferase SMYD3-like isoform X2 [Stegodyphus dumicola]
MAEDRQQYYNPGDIIYKKKAFVTVLRKDLHAVMCENCFERSFYLKRCGACHFTQYCGKKCQEEAWSDHNLECKFLKNLPDTLVQDIVQIVAKVILKIKGKNWSEITDQIGNEIVSFADLDSRKAKLESDPKTQLLVKEVIACLETYIGEENLPETDRLIEIIGKVKNNMNSYSLSPDAPKIEVHSLFIGPSLIKHSCISNSTFMFDRHIVEIRITRKIKKDIKEVTHNLFTMVCAITAHKTSRSSRRARGEECTCCDCSKPYGTSVLTKIIDDKRAYGVVIESEILLDVISSLTDIHGSDLSRAPLPEVIEEVLKKQEGVLGDTNILRLRLLAVKCLFMNGYPSKQVKELKKLLESMKFVFGEYYEELIPIYRKLLLLGRVFLDHSTYMQYGLEFRRLMNK